MRRTDRLLRAMRPYATWGLGALALLVSHDLIWFVQVGPGEDLTALLRSAGHGYWGAASLLLAAAAVGAGAAMLGRLVLLRHRAARLGASGHGPRVRRSRGRALAIWSRLFAVVAIGFAVQENAEHLVSHGHLPLLGTLTGPEYPLALPVIGAITFVAAMLAAVVTSIERHLVATITAALLAAPGRAPVRLGRRPTRSAGRCFSPLGGAWAGRAPPLLVAA